MIIASIANDWPRLVEIIVGLALTYGVAHTFGRSWGESRYQKRMLPLLMKLYEEVNKHFDQAEDKDEVKRLSELRAEVISEIKRAGGNISPHSNA